MRNLKNLCLLSLGVAATHGELFEKLKDRIESIEADYDPLFVRAT
ncbi:hypothetical protein [Pseudomonas sp. Ga0074129]|nr:hypothetical protein [Pseudomonas sp. Ga0074129]